MEKSAPIVVFDSGFGGISVLKKLVDTMPNENYLYLGDSANAPYGPRDPEDVRRLTVGAIRSLLPFQPKAVVIACNTATAAAHEAVKQLCPDIPVIGIRPAVLQAEAAGCRNILSLATRGTLTSASYANQLRGLSPQTNVISVPAPGIVWYIERNKTEREAFISYLKQLLRSVDGIRIDGVVLGCTHFPFAKDEIREALGEDVRFFDASSDVAQETLSSLQAADLRNDDEESGSITFMNSLNRQTSIGFAWSLFASAC